MAPSDQEVMRRAVANAARSRFIAPPNPWVGAVLVTADGAVFDGATREPGGPHAERVVLSAAGNRARGATLYTTLEPCNHTGRTGPCAEAIVEAGVRRVVIGCLDPDLNVAGAGVETLQAGGIAVESGVESAAVEVQLRPYLHQRRTGRPFVVLKLAASLDGRTAAADGTSQWITGPEARAIGHRIRAQSNAVMVGAGTVRMDDPSLTVRDWHPDETVETPPSLDPLRIVLGKAPEHARVRPCVEVSGDLTEIVEDLGSQGVLQLMVEGGAAVAGAFHRTGLVDRYELFLAPALFGGADAAPLMSGAAAATIGDIWRGDIVSVSRAGADIHVSLEPARAVPGHR
jgi:diaminohydroxyphosphoribosylaminopyrimidine deaminase/5-amino-6-(5-phosphoribosylamino)uracil reductase